MCRLQPNPRVPFFNFAAGGPRKISDPAPNGSLGWLRPFQFLATPLGDQAANELPSSLVSFEA
jgi:hypothetical protein